MACGYSPCKFLTHTNPRFCNRAAQVREELALPDSALTPFKGLQLGTMIGKGGYGRVYRGMYEGQLVAVKVGPPSCTTHCVTQ